MMSWKFWLFNHLSWATLFCTYDHGLSRHKILDPSHTRPWRHFSLTFFLLKRHFIIRARFSSNTLKKLKKPILFSTSIRSWSAAASWRRSWWWWTRWLRTRTTPMRTSRAEVWQQHWRLLLFFDFRSINDVTNKNSNYSLIYSKMTLWHISRYGLGDFEITWLICLHKQSLSNMTQLNTNFKLPIRDKCQSRQLVTKY